VTGALNEDAGMSPTARCSLREESDGKGSCLRSGTDFEMSPELNLSRP
jgi:hypothetical protein